MRGIRALALLGVTVGVVAGCSDATGGEATPTSQTGSDSALASFDMCTVLSDDELRSFGFRPDTRSPEEGQGDVGCFWLGAPVTLGMVRNLEYKADETYDRSVVYEEIRDSDIGDRNAVLGIAGVGSCSLFIDAGSGSAFLLVRSDQDPNVDACTEVVRIAELVAPRLPEVGS